MHTGIFWQIVYWLSTPVLASLAGILLYRRLAHKFPFFFSYIVVSCLGDLFRLAAYRLSANAYKQVYWISHLGSTIFMLLAAYELFITRLFPRFYKVSFYRYLFSIAAAVVIILGLLTSLGSIEFTVLANVIRTLDFCRVIVLLFFVALMIFMGRHWGRYEFGIAAGLGVDSAAFLITFAIFIRSGRLHGLIRELPVFATDLACLIWLISFLRPEEPTLPPTAGINAEVLQQAKEWEQTLKGSLTEKKGSE